MHLSDEYDEVPPETVMFVEGIIGYQILVDGETVVRSVEVEITRGENITVIVPSGTDTSILASGRVFRT